MAGEIWVAGPNVVVAYLGRPDVSEHTFCARLRGSAENFPAHRDVGFVHDGGLHVADVPVV
jgi:acyl-CoA synthetase (AMP-forming)/AMP-acid ligase II